MANAHEGHRKRLRTQFIKNGLDSMAPHQMLELLLFFAIPRIDTNVIAHNLIEKFGSLAGVFNASFEELCSVEGVGENASTLIKLMPQLYTQYALSVQNTAGFEDREELCHFFISQFCGINTEAVILLCLDDKLAIKHKEMISKGDGQNVTFDTRKIIEIVLRSGCSKCVISHNHPNSSCEPSVEDIRTTKRLCELLKEINVELYDHVVVGDDGARTIISLANN